MVGNGGADNNVKTVADDQAYQIGLDIFNNPLSDGATLNVPKGATLMVDAGAIFKLRQANINAGTFCHKFLHDKAHAFNIKGLHYRFGGFLSFS